jgi:hypothetical protein
VTGLSNPRPRPGGAGIERELRRQARERARRSGPSTAVLEAIVWLELVQYIPDASTRSIVAEHGDTIAALTGVRAQSKQRAIVDGAKAGLRVRLGGWGGFGDGAEQEYARAAQEALDEALRHKAELGGQGALDMRLRDAIARDAAQGTGTAQERLDRVNRALAEYGFDPISARSLRRVIGKRMAKA